MNPRYVFDSTIGLCGTAFAMLMFFYFPGLAAWTVAALEPPGFESVAWIHLLLVLAVVLPGVFGPIFLATRARRFAYAKLVVGCLALSSLFLVAAAHEPLLSGRVALMALLTGQLAALGLKAGKSVPWNWMVYIGFQLAYFTFPDPGILRAANGLAGGYLLGAGLMLAAANRSPRAKKSRYRVTIG